MQSQPGIYSESSISLTSIQYPKIIPWYLIKARIFLLSMEKVGYSDLKESHTVIVSGPLDQVLKPIIDDWNWPWAAVKLKRGIEAATWPEIDVPGWASRQLCREGYFQDGIDSVRIQFRVLRHGCQRIFCVWDKRYIEIRFSSLTWLWEYRAASIFQEGIVKPDYEMLIEPGFRKYPTQELRWSSPLY